MKKEGIIKLYSRKYREAGKGGEETNDQIAYKNILIALKNTTSLGDTWDCIAKFLPECHNEDRFKIYEEFLIDTHKSGRLGRGNY